MITSTVYCLLYTCTAYTYNTYIPLLNAMNDPVFEHNEGNVIMPEIVKGDGPIY